MAERRGTWKDRRSRSRSPVRRGEATTQREGSIHDRLKRVAGVAQDEAPAARAPPDNHHQRNQPQNNGGGFQSDMMKNQEQNQEEKIDREKTCPLLLRVFCQIGRHHRPDEFNRKTPSNELQIYTWKDASLKELMSLVKEVNPDARRKGTYFDFAIVFPNPNHNRGGFIIKDIGTTCSGQKCPDDNVTLRSKNFQIGDFLDISVVLPPKSVREGAI